MKMGDVHANDPSREDHDAKGQRPGAVDETLEQRASAEALLLFRQLKVLRDDDELPDDFVIDSKRIHNLYLELFEMFILAIGRAHPTPAGQLNGTRLATAAKAIATAIADHLNKNGVCAKDDTQNLSDLADNLENPNLKDAVLATWIAEYDADLFGEITSALTEIESETITSLLTAPPAPGGTADLKSKVTAT